MHLRFYLGLVIIALGLWASPAIAQQATPAATPGAGVMVETVCAGTLPAGSIPQGETFVDFYRTSLPAGTALDFPTDFLVPGAGMDCLESGTYHMQSDGPLELYRGEGAGPEMATPGDEYIIEPGDIVLILDNDYAQRYTVEGDEPAVILSVMIMSTQQPECAPGSCPTYPVETMSEQLGSLPSPEWIDHGLTGTDLLLTVSRVTLESGISLPTSDDQWPAVRFVESGLLTWLITESGASTPRADLDFRPGDIVPYFRPEQGAQITLHNAGPDPVTYLELTITPANP